MGFLRLVLNPRDSAALRRVINVPPRGIGGVTMRRLASVAEARNLSLSMALAELVDAGGGGGVEWGGLRGAQVDKLVEFELMMRGVRVRGEGRSVLHVLDDMLEVTGYARHMEGGGDGEGAGERWASVLELKDSARRCETPTIDRVRP